MDDIENLVEVYRDKNFKPSKPEDSQNDGEKSEGEISSDEPEFSKEITSEPVGYDPTEKQFGGRAGAIRAIVTRCRISSGPGKIYFRTFIPEIKSLILHQSYSLNFLYLQSYC